MPFDDRQVPVQRIADLLDGMEALLELVCEQIVAPDEESEPDAEKARRGNGSR